MTLAQIERMIAELSAIADDPDMPEIVIEESLFEVQRLCIERDRLRALMHAH